MMKTVSSFILLLGVCLNISAVASEQAVQVQIEASLEGLDVNKLVDVSQNQRSFSSGKTTLPRVTTKFDQEARVVTLREYRHPVSFSAPFVPKDWKTSELGVTMRITPLKGTNGGIYYFGSLIVAAAPDLKERAASKSEMPTIVESTKRFFGEIPSGEAVKMSFFTPEGKEASFVLKLTEITAEGTPVKKEK